MDDKSFTKIKKRSSDVAEIMSNFWKGIPLNLISNFISSAPPRAWEKVDWDGNIDAVTRERWLDESVFSDCKA